MRCVDIFDIVATRFRWLDALLSQPSSLSLSYQRSQQRCRVILIRLSQRKARLANGMVCVIRQTVWDGRLAKVMSDKSAGGVSILKFHIMVG